MRKKQTFLFVAGLVLGWSAVSGAADPSLIGWWQLNESGGLVAADASGRGNDATLGGSAAHSPGLYGGGVYCDGTEAYVAIPNVLTQTCTLAFWFKPDWDGANLSDYRLFDASLGDKYFFIGKGANHTDITPAYFGLYFEDGADTDFQGIEITAAGNITANTWYHVAVSWQFGGGAAILYLNGKEVSRGTGLGAFPSVFQNPRFGYQSVTYIPMSHGAAAVLDDIKVFDRVLTAAEIPALMEGAALEAAAAPSPADKALDVLRDTVLSWAPGIYPATHDVYLGTTFADVNSAARTAAQGVRAGQGRADTTFDPPGVLAYGQTYYWRIDEVNQTPDNTIFKGAVWSFTVEPYAYPLTGVQATASSSQPDMGPEKTVDGSGMTGDQAGVGSSTMWMSKGTLPNWIRYEFDASYKLYELQVWNSNQMIESFIGFGAKDVAIEYSVDGVTWTTLAGVPQFAQGIGQLGYAANTTVSFGGVLAKYVKLTINQSWGGLTATTGLSEVRFSYVPVQARAPQPAVAATGVKTDTTLTWRPGREAGSHRVYFGADQAAVANGTVAAQTVADHAYTPGSLNFGTMYYWKVDEVNAVTYPGTVWSFTTQEYGAVDDFETYNDGDHRIYDSWIDGYTDGQSGSVVGNMTAPFAEQTIVHGGKQSMPLEYNNVKMPYYSEASRTFDTTQNWTTNGADTLSLWFRGHPTAFMDKGGNAYTLSGSGADIWNASDQFRFAYKSLNGDGSITMKVDSIGNTNVWAKAAPMIRETLDAGAKNVCIAVTPGSGVSAQWRDTSNGASANSQTTGIVAPYWVRVTRTGSTFKAEHSADGKTWTQQGASMTIAMVTGVYIGMAVTSHDAALTTVAEISNVSTTGAVTGSWQVVAIGATMPTNDATSLYLTVQDKAGKTKTVVNPNPSASAIGTWTQWKVPLSDLTGVNLTAVQKITLGVGDKTSPKAGAAGMLYFDDIGYGHPAQ